MKRGLTLIIPCYNEADLIGASFAEIEDYLAVKDDIYVNFVDDKSTDDTPEIITNLISGSAYKERIKLFLNPHNIGKGGAILAGLKEADTEYICFTDADLAYQLANVDNFMEHLSPNVLLIANRPHRDSTCLIKPSLLGVVFMRHLMSRAFNALVGLILFKEINDVQAGFKMGAIEDFRNVTSKTSKLGFSFDMEFLYIAKRRGLELTGLPVTYRYTTNKSSVNFFSDSVRMFIDLIDVKIKSLMGRYE